MSDMTPEKAQALLDGATPGPWRWEESHPTNACANVLAKTEGGWDVDVAILYGTSDDVPRPSMPDEPWGDHPIRRATSQLIAAAPDLARAYIAQAAEITRLREALTPSGGTKAAYSGEFSISVYDGESEDGEELYRKVLIDWTTIKAIMATIRARAALTAYKEAGE